MMRKVYLTMGITTASLILLSACSVFDPNNGVRVKNNVTKQTVDPYAGFDEGVATLDGVKAEKLLKEYRTESAAAPSESLLKEVTSGQ
jgi:hypothetical protein